MAGALKPPSHGRDHLPGGQDPIVGLAGGMQMHNGTYGDDNVGDWLMAETTGQVAQSFSKPTASAGDETSFGMALNPSAGLLLSDAPDNFFSNGNPVLQIQHSVSANHDGGEGLVINVIDTTPAPGDSEVIGAQITVSSHSTASDCEGLIISSTIGSGGSANAIALELSATNSGTGKAIPLSILGLPTSSVGLPTGAVWKNGNVLNIV